MASTWCPFCSKPNQYDITKPRFCGHCGKDMTAAFQTTPVSQPPGTPSKIVIASQSDTTPLRRPAPRYGLSEDPNDAGSPDDYYSPDNVQRRAAQLTASLRGGIHITLADEGTSMKLGTLSNLRDAFTKADAEETKGVRKSKGKRAQ